MTSSLTSLPNEVIQVILSYLPPFSNIALQKTCRQFADVANEPLLWKKYARQTYKWWDPRHAFQAKLADTSFIGWKSLFASRHIAGCITQTAINRIVNQELGRLDALRTILELGYDAKGELLDLFYNSAESENHLAQR
jgi:hypothetical protein